MKQTDQHRSTPGGTFIEFIATFIFVSIFNIMVYSSIRTRSRVLNKMGANGNQTLSAPSLGNLNKDKKAVRSLFTIVLVFDICWMPFEIAALILSVCPDCINPIVFEISFWLLWINSTINPVLYPLLHRRYKVAFMKLLHHKRRRIATVTRVA